MRKITLSLLVLLAVLLMACAGSQPQIAPETSEFDFGDVVNGVVLEKDLTFRTPSQEASAEINLAALEAGASIIAASSNYGGAPNDETWGANSAIDGNRGSAWSSDGDGNDAYIKIRLAQPARLTAVEVWTRSMSNGTAQIFSFTLTTDDGTVLGPFALDDAEQSYRFDVNAVASSLRLGALGMDGRGRAFDNSQFPTPGRAGQ